MDAGEIAWLLTPEGARAAEQARASIDAGIAAHTIAERLRGEYGAPHSRAALALVAGRLSAAAKFTDAGRLILDREAAEQATAEAVARWTARRFAGARRVADLGCGAGGDALALAEIVPVLAVDRDPDRVAMTHANAAIRRLTERLDVREGDALDPLPADIDAVWLDPARRDGSGRTLDPEAWSPPLFKSVYIASTVARAGIKAAPGLDLVHVPDGCEVEFISHRGGLVESVLWFGEAVSARRRATVLPQGASVAGEPDTGSTPLGAPGRYLFDLDASVGRASLIDIVAPTIEAWRLDERTAYLSGDTAVTSPFARRFRIMDTLPFAERRLRDVLRSLGASRVEVMRRASPVDTNALERRLNAALLGNGPVLTVALTRVGGTHMALVCERERDED
ncbi:MAG: class I SAM-dependent methyltransferase [Dehalococcoidia bacterium]|nr:MAG: class I SAM-dependent methyltransferase [Dehalococcoidia bacterium]